MKKKLLFLFAIVMTLALGFTTACFSTDYTPIDSSSSSGSSAGSEEVGVVLDSAELTLSEYETAVLKATVTGSGETLVWSSSDETVATVSDGVVSGIKAGSAVITATYGEATAECDVTVTKTVYAPQIKFEDEINLDLGDKFTDEVKVLWKGAQLTEGVTYAWTLADGEADDVCAVTSDGKYVTIEAKKVGQTAYYVAVTAKGSTVSHKVTVKVQNPKPTLIPADDSISSTNEGYKVDLWTASEGGDTEFTLSFNAFDGNSVVENAAITWDTEAETYDSGIATIEQTATAGSYLIKKVAAGATNLVGSYTSTANGEVATVKVTITVNKVVKTLDFKPTWEVANLSTVSKPNGVVGSLEKLFIGGKDVTSSASGDAVTVDKEKLPQKVGDLGEGKACAIETDTFIYNFTADIYTLIISNKGELNNFGALARTAGGWSHSGDYRCAFLDGYFILDSDIDYNGTFTSIVDTDYIYNAIGNLWQDSSAGGFRGIFDGKGYNIDGMTIKCWAGWTNSSGGFIGVLHDDGIVRNVSFTNATVEESQGLICSYGGGLIENVFVSYKALGVGKDTRDLDKKESEGLSRKMGTFFSAKASPTATVRNCFIDAIGATVNFKVGEKGQTNLTLGTLATNIENLIIVGGEERYGYGTTTYASTYESLIADADCQSAIAKMGDAWESVNGIPMLKKLAAKIDKDAPIDFTSKPETLDVGKSVEIGVTSRYSTITAELPTGVTYVDGVLTAAENAIVGSKAKLTVKSCINDSTAMIEVLIKVAKNVISLEYNPTWEVSNLSTVELPSTVAGTIEELRINDVNILSSVSGNTVTVDKTKLPQKAVDLGDEVPCSVETDTTIYNFNAKIYTLIISNKGELDNFGELARTAGGWSSEGTKCGLLDGYFILDSDIEYNDTFTSITDSDYQYGACAWTDFTVSGFQGIFDGRGYNIDGLAVKSRAAWTSWKNSSGGFIGFLHKDGIVRNVSFTNATVEECQGLICSYGDGLIEDVFVSYKALGVGKSNIDLDTDNNVRTSRKMGTFFSTEVGTNATVRNCFIDATGATVKFKVGEKGQTNLTLGTLAKNVENLIIVGGKTEYGYGTTTYASTYESLIADADCQSAIAKMGDAWESVNGIPMLKKLAEKIDKTAEIAFVDAPAALDAGKSVDIAVTSRYSTVTAECPAGVTYVDGKLTATEEAKNGAIVTLTVKSCINDSTATITIAINAPKAKVTLEYNPTWEVSNLSTVELPSTVTGTIEKMFINDVNVLSSVSGNTVTVDKTKLPQKAVDLGDEVPCSVETDTTIYNFNAKIYTLIISNKGELDSFGALARTAGGWSSEGTKCGLLDGYFILDSDIEYNGTFTSIVDSDYQYGACEPSSNWTNYAVSGFQGVFDGKGYNIDGLRVKSWASWGTWENSSGGFIGILHNDGIVRNVSFTNATVEESQGFICSYGGGLIENVFVSYKAIGVGTKSNINIDTNNPRKMGTFFSTEAGSNATVKNCFIDATTADIKFVTGATGKTNLTLGTLAKNVENLIIVGGKTEYGYGTTTYASTYADLLESEACQSAIAKMGDAWESVNGIPMLKKLAEKIDKTAEIAFVDAPATLDAGKSVDIAVTSRYSTVSVTATLPDGVTYENGELTASASVQDGTTVTLKVVSAINDSTATIMITITNQ